MPPLDSLNRVSLVYMPYLSAGNKVTYETDITQYALKFSFVSGAAGVRFLMDTDTSGNNSCPTPMYSAIYALVDKEA